MDNITTSGIAEKTWWEGNSTKLWRVIIILFMGLMGFLCTYIFTEVANIPKVYAERSQVLEIKKEMAIHFNVLNSKIDEINRYLRDAK